jgi:hypothetical protein
MPPIPERKTNAEVRADIATRYNATDTQVDSLLAYYGAVKSTLNPQFRASGLEGQVEVKKGTISKASNFIGKALSILPFGSAAEIVTDGIGEIDQALKESDLRKIAKVVAVIEEGIRVPQFTKDLAEDLVGVFAQDLKNMTPKQAQERAQEDCKSLKKQICKGNFENLSQEADARSLSDDENSEQSGCKSLRAAMVDGVAKDRGRDLEQERAREEAKSALHSDSSYEATHPTFGQHTRAAVDHHNKNPVHVH